MIHQKIRIIYYIDYLLTIFATKLSAQSTIYNVKNLIRVCYHLKIQNIMVKY